jgi:hypothetical protein
MALARSKLTPLSCVCDSQSALRITLWNQISMPLKMIVLLTPEEAASENFSVGRSAAELYSSRRRSSAMSFGRPRNYDAKFDVAPVLAITGAPLRALLSSAYEFTGNPKTVIGQFPIRCHFVPAYLPAIEDLGIFLSSRN